MEKNNPAHAASQAADSCLGYDCYSARPDVTKLKVEPTSVAKAVENAQAFSPDAASHRGLDCY